MASIEELQAFTQPINTKIAQLDQVAATVPAAELDAQITEGANLDYANYSDFREALRLKVLALTQCHNSGLSPSAAQKDDVTKHVGHFENAVNRAIARQNALRDKG